MINELFKLNFGLLLNSDEKRPVFTGCFLFYGDI